MFSHFLPLPQHEHSGDEIWLIKAVTCDF